ncbi:MAG: NAD+ synthase [candidate division Zixibacteria bacterium]|nr:NAD+ synthase [candidate division Zixibacteria bacterium]
MSQQIDPEKSIVSIKRFLTGRLTQSGLTGYVIGLSGGIDSAVSAALAVEAVGRDKVFGVLMPYRTSSKTSIEDATTHARQLGIEFQVIDISPMIDAYFGPFDESLRLRAGNKMARERMSILFDIAHKLNRLVLGTGNRTEICLGYTTWYGDSACSVNPLGELYKTDVRKIARILRVPPSIIAKHPTADLWVGQTDEGEIGVTYERIDQLLGLMIDRNVTSLANLEQAGFKRAEIDRIVALVNRNSFKRRLPDIAPLGRGDVPDHIVLH